MNVKKNAALVAVGAVALMAGATSAGARHPKQSVITLDSHCDRLFIAVYPEHQQAAMEQYCNGAQVGVGVGMVGKVTGVNPKDLTFGVNYSEAPPGTVYLYNFQYPLVTGNSWSIFSTADGVNFSPVDSGTYTVGNAEAVLNRHEGPPAIPAVRK